MNRGWLNQGLIAGIHQKMRGSLLLLAALICLPVWSVPLPPSVAFPHERTWTPGPVYMQIGKSCVGYALAAWLDAAPDPITAHASGWQIYEAAQEQDGIAGPHEGTTMEAALAVLARLGYAHDWQATTDPARAITFLRADGPIVILSAFPDGPAVLDADGNLVWAGTESRHAWLCYSVDTDDRLGCQDSAGSAWNPGEGGRFHMSRAALAQVLTEGRAWLIHKAPPRPAA